MQHTYRAAWKVDDGYGLVGPSRDLDLGKLTSPLELVRDDLLSFTPIGVLPPANLSLTAWPQHWIVVRRNLIRVADEAGSPNLGYVVLWLLPAEPPYEEMPARPI